MKKNNNKFKNFKTYTKHGVKYVKVCGKYATTINIPQVVADRWYKELSDKDNVVYLAKSAALGNVELTVKGRQLVYDLQGKVFDKQVGSFFKGALTVILGSLVYKVVANWDCIQQAFDTIVAAFNC